MSILITLFAKKTVTMQLLRVVGCYYFRMKAGTIGWSSRYLRGRHIIYKNFHGCSVPEKFKNRDSWFNESVVWRLDKFSEEFTGYFRFLDLSRLHNFGGRQPISVYGFIPKCLAKKGYMFKLLFI